MTDKPLREFIGNGLRKAARRMMSQWLNKRVQLAKDKAALRKPKPLVEDP